MIEVRRASSEQDVATAYAIRHEVFVIEQGVPLELEQDELDATAVHVLALLDGDPVGAGRYFVDGTAAHLGRLAVRVPARGLGAGVALVRGLEDLARSAGLSEAVLGAQVHAVGFYERLGYVAEGGIFDDAGIDHRWMRRSLSD